MGWVRSFTASTEFYPLQQVAKEEREFQQHEIKQLEKQIETLKGQHETKVFMYKNRLSVLAQYLQLPIEDKRGEVEDLIKAITNHVKSTLTESDTYLNLKQKILDTSSYATKSYQKRVSPHQGRETEVGTANRRDNHSGSDIDRSCSRGVYRTHREFQKQSSIPGTIHPTHTYDSKYVFSNKVSPKNARIDVKTNLENRYRSSVGDLSSNFQPNSSSINLMAKGHQITQSGVTMPKEDRYPSHKLFSMKDIFDTSDIDKKSNLLRDQTNFSLKLNQLRQRMNSLDGSIGSNNQ